MIATNCSSSLFKDLSLSRKSLPLSPVSPDRLNCFPRQGINILKFTFSGLYFSLMHLLCLFLVKFLKRTYHILKLLKSDFWSHQYSEIDHTKIFNNFLLVFTTLDVNHHFFLVSIIPSPHFYPYLSC